MLLGSDGCCGGAAARGIWDSTDDDAVWVVEVEGMLLLLLSPNVFAPVPVDGTLALSLQSGQFLMTRLTVSLILTQWYFSAIVAVVLLIPPCCC